MTARANEAGHGDTREAILALLLAERSVDFSDYRPAAITRGITARCHALGLPNEDALLARLRADPSEIDTLVHVLVIRYTAFFRERDVFDALGRVVLPELCAKLGSRGPARAWSIGCATGEEAWSLAMLLAEACEPSDRSFDLLASDIHEAALRTARAACYPESAALTVPPGLRDRFLSTSEGFVRIAPSLRARVRFARHDLFETHVAPPEAVVACFDVVLLRNALIYFRRSLQERALERIAAVLEPGGALVLGHVETLPPSARARFAIFPGTAPGLHIYRRLAP